MKLDQDNNFNAIIIGGTGATGKHLLNLLLNNRNCKLVTSIGRNSVLDGKKNDKLLDIIVDSLYNLSSTEKYWKNNDVFFNCIGTTRKRSGGPKEFINIEFGISKEAARMAENAKIPHASLISAKGANHKMWATDWIHPLLYMKTIGQKEQTILSNYTFNQVSIFKPGMLIRFEDKETWLENIFVSKDLGLRVDTLAMAMMRDAEKSMCNPINDSPKIYIGNQSIKDSLNL